MSRCAHGVGDERLQEQRRGDGTSADPLDGRDVALIGDVGA